MTAALALRPPQEARPDGDRKVLDAVRTGVREVLEATPAFNDASPAVRHALAARMVRVSMLAAEQLAEEQRVQVRIRKRGAARASAMVAPVASAMADKGPTRAAAEFKALREAIDFPTYVQSLITGVFSAITKSSIAQLEALGDMLDNVGASGDAFASRNVSDGLAARWVVGRFPYFEIKAGAKPTDRPRLVLKEDVDLAEKYDELAKGIEATKDEVEAIDEDELEETLLPLARRKMGRDKQSMLATMVMMGIQRIVVDQGRLHASMDMRVDARELTERQQQERSDMRVTTSASGSFGAGPWGASASVSASVGYVKSDEQYSKEEVASQAALRSSVDLVFRTENVSLDTLATPTEQRRIASQTKIPETKWSTVSGGSILTTDRMTKREDFGKVPDAPTPPKAPDPLELAKLNPAKDKDATPKKEPAKTEPANAAPVAEK
jgi:hypothetical protein